MDWVSDSTSNILVWCTCGIVSASLFVVFSLMLRSMMSLGVLVSVSIPVVAFVPPLALGLSLVAVIIFLLFLVLLLLFSVHGVVERPPCGHCIHPCLSLPLYETLLFTSLPTPLSWGHSFIHAVTTGMVSHLAYFVFLGLCVGPPAVTLIVGLASWCLERSSPPLFPCLANFHVCCTSW